MIDGVSSFLFLDDKVKPMVAYHWEKKFQRSVEKYNKIYKVELPKIIPHVCRHTYCTNMAKSGISVKTLQYLMGHSDISVTMNVYTHLELADAKDEFGKTKIERAGKKGKGIVRYGICQARIKESESGMNYDGKKRIAVRVVKFTAICTAFTYQDRVKYDKIYHDRGLKGNAKPPSKIKEIRGYTKICEIK